MTVSSSKLGHLVRQFWMEFVPAVTEAVNNRGVPTHLTGLRCALNSLSEYHILN